MRYVFLLLAAFMLSGCASTEYVQYARTQEAIEVAKANAEASRFKAIGDIARDGDTASKIAAVMALALGNNATSSQGSNVAAPEKNQALQWASILVPGLTQVYGLKVNANVAMRASDNAAATGIATTAGFVALSGKIQSAGATTSSIYNISGNSGTNSGNATATPTVVNQPAGQASNNTYTYSGNSGANSGNATATPTVVNQPPPVVVTTPGPAVVNPVIVTQPPPIIVTQPPPVIVKP